MKQVDVRCVMSLTGTFYNASLPNKMSLLASLLLLLFLSSSPALSQERTYTFAETMRYALENSPDFDSAKKTQMVRDLEQRTAIAKLLPSLDFTTVDGLANTIPIPSATSGLAAASTNATAPWSSSVTMGLSETFYDNGASLTGIEVANLNRDLALMSFKKARDHLLLDVMTEFYHYSLDTKLLEVRKQQQAILDKQFRTLSSQYQQGLKTMSDYLRIKTQVQRAEIDTVTAQNTLQQSEANLRKLIGSGIGSDESLRFLAIQVEREKSGDGLLGYQSPEIENTFDYRINKIQREIDSRSVDLVKRKYWPQLSVASALNYQNQNYINSGTSFTKGHQLSWNALVTLQYNFWDWGIRRRDITIAEYNRDIKSNTLEQDLLEIKSQITSLMADLLRIAKNYKLSQELLTLEEDSTRDVEAKYREGKVNYLDLVTELNNLLDAKVQFYTAYFDALASEAKYQYYQGRLYETAFEK